MNILRQHRLGLTILLGAIFLATFILSVVMQYDMIDQILH